jgi:hypothetical protein
VRLGEEVLFRFGVASGIWSLSKSRYKETLGKIHGSSDVKTFIVCTKRNNNLSDPNLYHSISKEERVLIIGRTPFNSCSTNKRAEFGREIKSRYGCRGKHGDP